MVTDDLDGVFVGADSTVRTQTPEFTALGSFWNSMDVVCYFQVSEGNIIDDTDGEFIFRCI